MFPLMTEKEYREYRGMRCPVCRDHYIDVTGALYLENGVISKADYACRMCNSTWTEVYTLTGFVNLKEGGEACSR